MEPVVVLLSGGINSTVAAARAGGAALHFLYLDYGHRAAPAERRAVKQISEALAGTLHVVELTTLTNGSNNESRADGNVPDDGASATGYPTDRRSSGLMLAMFGLAQQLATRVGATEIVCGASQVCNETDLEADSGQGEPDARHVFLHAALVAMQMALPAKRRLTLDIPFVESKRTDVVQLGFRIGAPLHMTWSCHLSGDAPCEKCIGCKSRATAFAALGHNDPRLAPVR